MEIKYFLAETPNKLVQVINTYLQQHPEQRPVTMSICHKELFHLIQGHPVVEAYVVLEEQK